MNDRKKNISGQIFLPLLFMMIGSTIMIVFSPWQPILNRELDYVGRIGLITILVLLYFLLRKNDTGKKYLAVLYGLIVLMAAVSLDWIVGVYLIDYVGVKDDSPVGWALQKLNEFIVIVTVVITLTKLSRESLGSIYIQRGNIKNGLIIGLVTFGIAAAGSVPMATLFNAKDLSFTRMLPWIPWILIIVLANGTMEEIMFRGLFLRKLEPIVGKFVSNLLVAFVFTVLHGAATYTVDQYLFVAILFPLALTWGYIMQKTDAVWASILFHAGMDIPIILGIFSNQF